MKTVSMSGSPRENVGKKDAKKQRAEGRVPCVLYGGEEQIHFTMDEKALTKLLFTPETFFIDMDIEGKVFKCLMKDIQYHPVSDRVLHADFLEYSDDKPVVSSIPVRTVGVAPGVVGGGVLVQKFRKVAVKALPGNMPESIEIDISSLEINDTIHVRDIAQDKFEVMEKGERYVCGVKTTRLAAVGDAAELAAEEAELAGEEGEEGEEGGVPAEGETKTEE